MLPKDPNILLSYINTKLRDDYAGLDECCEDLEIEREALERALAAIGAAYDPARNRFV